MYLFKIYLNDGYEMADKVFQELNKTYSDKNSRPYVPCFADVAIIKPVKIISRYVPLMFPGNKDKITIIEYSYPRGHLKYGRSYFGAVVGVAVK